MPCVLCEVLESVGSCLAGYSFARLKSMSAKAFINLQSFFVSDLLRAITVHRAVTVALLDLRRATIILSRQRFKNERARAADAPSLSEMARK
jgi:hypothetical protein